MCVCGDNLSDELNQVEAGGGDPADTKASKASGP